MGDLKPLREPQVLAMNDLRAAATRSKRIVLQASTGFGKTNLFCHMVHGARAKSRRVVFVVPSITLIDQTFERLIDNGIEPVEIGVLQSDHPWRRPHAPIQIATSQTLANRDRPIADLVVIDEVHELFQVMIDWMADPEAQSTLFVGLSATPWTKGLGKHFDTLVKTTPLRDLIADGYLSRFKVFAPSHPDLAGVKTRATQHGMDYATGQLSERMSNKQLVADVVSTWLAQANGEPTLCFAVDRAHASKLHEQFQANGVRSAYVDMHTSREERVAIGQRLGSGELQVVVNIGTLTKGVDWIVRCLVLARPTRSESLFVQIIGRALRPEYADGFDLTTKEGRIAAMDAGPKPFALILDHSDTHLRLGMVTDIDHDELDDGKPKKKSAGDDDEDRVPLPKECGECAGLVPPGAKECPCCGAAVKRRSGVETADGELVEMTSSTSMKREKPAPVIEQLRAMGKPSIIGQLYALRDERQRSDGWVAHQYREIFGVWPRGLDQAPALEPTHVLRSWVRSRAIAYAKKLEKQREQGEVVI